jgi:hypothetical protein
MKIKLLFVKSFVSSLLITGWIGFLMTGCSKTDDYRIAGFSPVQIKGIEVRNTMGEHLGDLGYPDINTRHGVPDSLTQWDMALVAFPNPGTTSSGMLVLIGITPPFQPVKLWIVPAYFSSGTDISGAFPVSGILSSVPVAQWDTVFTPSVFTTRVKLRNIPEGFYRIYFKSKQVLLWDNIAFVKP